MSQQTGQSVQSDVLDAAVAVLVAGGLNAFRTRFKAFAEAELPAISVQPEDAEDEFQDAGSVEERLRFKVVHTVAAVDAADKAADLVYVQAHKLLMADPTLGGLVRTIRPLQKKWEQEQAEKQLLSLAVIYETEFGYNRSDPSVASY